MQSEDVVTRQCSSECTQLWFDVSGKRRSSRNRTCNSTPDWLNNEAVIPTDNPSSFDVLNCPLASKRHSSKRQDLPN